MLTHLLPLAAPLILLAVAYAIRTADAPRAARFGEYAGLGALAVAALSVLIVIVRGGGDSPLIGWDPLGLMVRLDVVSATMLALVGFIGWIVLRFSKTYMRSDPAQTRFTFWLLATIGAVMVLVQAGTLAMLLAAWIATSACLHRLLVFYPERVGAQRAARKKFISARMGDVSLGLAAVFLYVSYDTSIVSAILSNAATGTGGFTAGLAAFFLAAAALLKSAQFPIHGWLTEVMEAPTPVSALLHAGVVNAGGFLLIRFADVMLLAPLVLALLVIIGGFTALFGGLVMLTQPTVKTSLAWSTIAQMGFMILQCGLALFPLALLHIVAHSLYKAHAFLSSGGAVELVASIKRPGPVAIPNVSAVGRAFGLALALYGAVYLGYAAVFGFDSKSLQAVALGAVLILGVAYLLAQGIADLAPKALTRKTAIYATVTALSYFALQSLAEWATLGTLPAAPAADALIWALLVVTVVSFGAVAFAQATFPLWSHHPSAAGLRVHLSNGLYINAVWDRWIGGWSLKPTFGAGEKS